MLVVKGGIAVQADEDYCPLCRLRESWLRFKHTGKFLATRQWFWRWRQKYMPSFAAGAYPRGMIKYRIIYRGPFVFECIPEESQSGEVVE